MTPRAAILGCAALLFAAASAASATTYNVLPDGTGDFVTIQDAIDAAIPGDEIVLGDGTFVGPGNRDLQFLGKNLILRSLTGDPSVCTIDCQGQSRGLSITQGETNVRVEGITIRNGFAPSVGGPPAAPGWGGGINLSGVTATFRFCEIRGCSADDTPGVAIAAGAYAINSTVAFVDCSFTGNFFSSRGTGAGLFAWGNSTVTAVRCRFAGNIAPGTTGGGTGGGIRVQESRLTLDDCEIVGNVANIGAGISTGELCLVDFNRCLVAGNANNTPQGSQQAAGIQFGYDTDGSVRSCTITRNEAYDRGAGISVANDCNLRIENTILWGSCIGSGIGESAYILSDGFVDFVCSDVDPAKVTGGTVTYTNSLSVDPLFCGPELCIKAPIPQGTYTIDANSPLVNALGCGLIGRSPAGCGTVDTPLCPVGTNGVAIGCAPNPFRGPAALQYSIPEAGPVVVSLFDAAGRLVMRFDEGIREAGAHLIAWNGLSRDGSRIPSGVHFVRVSSRGFEARDRIVRVD